MNRLDVRTPPLGLVRITGPTHEGHMHDVSMWTSRRGFTVITSVDAGDLHLSIARIGRYPSWDEILAVRTWYFPDEMEVVMVLARRSEYVNLHPHCFHLWQSRCGEEGR